MGELNIVRQLSSHFVWILTSFQIGLCVVHLLTSVKLQVSLCLQITVISDENEDFSGKLKYLVEETYHNGGNRPVVLVGHSLGAKYAMYFLKSMTGSWKKTYIKTLVLLSAPLGGSVKALKIEASGDNFGMFIRSPLSFRPVQRTLPSLASFYRILVCGHPPSLLLLRPQQTILLMTMNVFFRDINYSVGYQMMLDSKPIIDAFEKPVDIDDIYCIHGSNLSTTDKMIYSPPSIFHGAFPDQVPTLIPGNGDGTVSIRSLEVCKRWPGVKYYIIPGAEHVNVMGDPRFIDIIRRIVGANVTKAV
ncbi:unnamed protein product [Heterobilharzia americana]|nr:unnamed protein product [Heterobilharzia americana]